jgi:trans-aconitate methyltransferase
VGLVQKVLPHEVRIVLIDLGCDTGRFTVALAEPLRVSMIGINPSQKMLREAARNTSSSHVE